MVGGSAAAAILFLVLVMHFASAPSYSTLLTGLDPAQTGKITSTLDTKGIPYQIENNGTALAVASGDTAQARIALATAGLLGSSTNQPGFELFNSQQLGESDFQQQITYQRALEGQLDETINSIQGVSGAQVQLVLPNSQNQIFGESNGISSAAVLLSGTTSLDPGSVRGIAQLVASSVPGLQTSVGVTSSQKPAVQLRCGGKDLPFVLTRLDAALWKVRFLLPKDATGDVELALQAGADQAKEKKAIG